MKKSFRFKMTIVKLVTVLCVILIPPVLCSEMLKHLYVDHIIAKFEDDPKGGTCKPGMCKLSFITRQKKALTCNCYLPTPADGIDVRVTLYYRFTGGYRQFLVDLNMDLCTYVGKAGLIFDKLKEPVQKYSTNVWQDCPFTGNMSLNKMPLDENLLPQLFLPAGDYYLHGIVTIDHGKRKSIDIKGYFTIAAGRTIEDDRMG